MSRIAYVNGRYLPHASAGVSIEDRGYQFADGIYEVVEIFEGELIDEAPHMARLDRSLRELAMARPMSDAALALVLREVVARNRVRDGMVYIQVTRGVAARDHAFPKPGTKPGLVVTARAIDPALGFAKASKGIRVITLPDERWARPDIKTISLLPNVLARQRAKEQGAGEAWLVGRDGRITEGAATNAWIVTAEGRIVTHAIDRSILEGVTRRTLLGLIARQGLVLEERAFTAEEAYAAREAFVTGATTLVMPVVAIDDRPIGNGEPGPIATMLRRDFHITAGRTRLTFRSNAASRPLRGAPQTP